jgi:hypothetical protein
MIKRKGREASAGTKNGGATNPFPRSFHGVMINYVIKHRHNLGHAVE